MGSIAIVHEAELGELVSPKTQKKLDDRTAFIDSVLGAEAYGTRGWIVWSNAQGGEGYHEYVLPLTPKTRIYLGEDSRAYCWNGYEYQTLQYALQRPLQKVREASEDRQIKNAARALEQDKFIGQFAERVTTALQQDYAPERKSGGGAKGRRVRVELAY